MLPIVIVVLAFINAVFLFISLPFDTTSINKNGKRTITKSGITAIVGLFIFVILPFIQYEFQEKESSKSENRIVSNLTSNYQNSVETIQNIIMITQ